MPVRDTDAQGHAIFQVNPAGTAISYRLVVANIENVTQAHIHLGAAGATGGIVAWLYPAAPPSQLIPGRSQGTLGEGEITAASLVGTLAGKPLSDLLDAMQTAARTSTFTRRSSPQVRFADRSTDREICWRRGNLSRRLLNLFGRIQEAHASRPHALG